MKATLMRVMEGLVAVSLMPVLLPAFVHMVAAAEEADESTQEEQLKMPNASFFDHCAFISIDFQAGNKQRTVESIPENWKELGYTREDCEAAVAFAQDVAEPNAEKVTTASRAKGLSMIFVHWQTLFDDGMDLEPKVREMLIEEFGEDKVHGSRSAPADFLDIQEGEYVIPKAGQDAFTSSNLDFVLRNLKVKHLVFIGGHCNPNGCLFRTARSAHERGYTTLCIEDATYDAGESTRLLGIRQVPFHYALTTEEYLELLDRLGEPQTP